MTRRWILGLMLVGCSGDDGTTDTGVVTLANEGVTLDDFVSATSYTDQDLPRALCLLRSA